LTEHTFELFHRGVWGVVIQIVVAATRGENAPLISGGEHALQGVEQAW
jgi:hypothetical protein